MDINLRWWSKLADAAPSGDRPRDGYRTVLRELTKFPGERTENRTASGGRKNRLRRHAGFVMPARLLRIEYEINPRMDRSRAANPSTREQWRGRVGRQELGCQVERGTGNRTARHGFTANAGLAAGNSFSALSSERREYLGLSNGSPSAIRDLIDKGLRRRGDAFAGKSFCGYRFRSDIRSHQVIGERLNRW